MARVFIAGHGRMLRSGSLSVPSGVSITWAVPPRYNGSVGLSTALLSRRYDTWAGRTASGEPFYEHFLCPDGAHIKATKAAAMLDGDWRPPGQHYLLQPRLTFTVSLSSILLFLKRLVPGSLEVYWTCCRSPIKEPSYMTRLFEIGATKDTPGAGNVIADPGEIHSSPKISGMKVGSLLSRRDFRSPYTEAPVCVNDIAGGVTIKCLTDDGFALQGTWPGVDEAAPKHGRGRSGSTGPSIKG